MTNPRSIDELSPKLKKIEIKSFKVNYQDFYQFVKECYPKIKDYTFVEVQECGNDSSHLFTVPTKGHAYSWDKEEIEKIRNGNVDGYCNSYILQALFLDGFIDEGNYLIMISW